MFSCVSFIYLLQKPYKVVEFEDGVALIRSSWLADDNFCSYPPYKDQSKINSAIAGMPVPADDWMQYKVKRIFGSAGKSFLLNLVFIKGVIWRWQLLPQISLIQYLRYTEIINNSIPPRSSACFATPS